MENIPTTDQWKLDGNCAQCRRSSYCNKDCSARKRHQLQIVKNLFEKECPGLENLLKEIPRYE